MKEFEQGWICTCGRYNTCESSQCSLCQNIKDNLLNMCSEDGMNKIIEKYHNIREEEKRVAIEAEKKQKRRTRKKLVGVLSGIIGLVIIIILISNAVTMSKRQTYNSVEEMREAMQGNWSCRSDYDIVWQLQIEGDKCTTVYAGIEDTFEDDVIWHPSEGTLKIGCDTYIVASGGRTMEGKDKYLYEKDGITLTPGASKSFNMSER